MFAKPLGAADIVKATFEFLDYVRFRQKYPIQELEGFGLEKVENTNFKIFA